MKPIFVSMVAIGALVLSSVASIAQVKKAPGTAGEILKLDATVRPRNIQRTTHFLGFQAKVDRIQLAIVLDGTESMSQEFQSLRDNLKEFASGIVKNHGKANTTIELTAVIYRDTGDPKPVQIMSNTFLDIDSFQMQFNEMTIGTGTPFFQERVDEGLHAAIETLEWAPETEESVARCILLCGDAPPYPEDQVAFRKHTTETLVKLAKEKQISVHSVLCTSGFTNGNPNNERLAKTADKLRPDMVKFMRNVSSQTGGGYIDTSDVNQLRQAVDESFKVSRQVREITQADIQRVRTAGQDKVGHPLVRLAVLPHLPFEKMTFEPWVRLPESEPEPREEWLVATQMRQLFPELGGSGIVVVGPTEVEKEVTRIVAAIKNDGQRISALATALHVDYIIWGKYENNGKQVALSTGIYGGLGGNLIVNASTTAPADIEFALAKQTQMTVQKLCDAVDTLSGDELGNKTHKAAFGRDAKVPVIAAMVTPVARDLRAQRSLLAGMELLERALGYLKPEFAKNEEADKSRELLNSAISELKLTIAKEPDNPLAHLLLSCCYYNRDVTGKIGVEHKAFNEHLSKAYEFRNSQLPSHEGRDVSYLSNSKKHEVEAYYALFNHRPLDAVKLFDELSKTNESVRGHFALRANWMLAGLYLGDWGVSSAEPTLLSTEKARTHILNILANWAGSPEEKFYQECLRPGKPNDIPAGSSSIELTSVFEPFH